MELRTKNYPAAIKEWSEDERPREKMLANGCNSMSNVELLAIIINSGTKEKSALDLAKEILSMVDNNILLLATKSADYFVKNFKGIGSAKAVSIVAALELGRRRGEAARPNRSKIACSKDSFVILSRELCDLQHEEMWALFLNNACKMLTKHRISEGGFTRTVVDVRKILKIAIENNATGVIIAHNHPSGNLLPSKEDIELTKEINSALKMLQIKLLDHLIINGNDYFSFSDKQLG
jgi:DNA repair protein RadC